jgi:5-carboxymethyl-2-hydroxymuconate isomerase
MPNTIHAADRLSLANIAAMPHIILEYSANLDGQVALDPVLDAVHSAALATGIFPIGGLRTRAERRTHFRIADLHPENAFVHLTVKIGHGRDLPTKQQACEQIFSALTDALAEVFSRRPLGISLELVELHPELSLKHNNLHDYVRLRAERA